MSFADTQGQCAGYPRVDDDNDGIVNACDHTPIDQVCDADDDNDDLLNKCDADFADTNNSCPSYPRTDNDDDGIVNVCDDTPDNPNEPGTPNDQNTPTKPGSGNNGNDDGNDDNGGTDDVKDNPQPEVGGAGGNPGGDGIIGDIQIGDAIGSGGSSNTVSVSDFSCSTDKLH